MSYSRKLAVVPLFFFAQLAASEPLTYQKVPDVCKTASPRFPKRYADNPVLKAVSRLEHFHRIDLTVKDELTNLNIEAYIEEVDLDGDGTCDEVIVVQEPVGAGGDSEVLATIYLAQEGAWKRIGAQSPTNSDYPSVVLAAPARKNNDFRFSDFAALRQPGQGPTYLVAWRHERVVCGFDGYRIFRVDRASARLIELDKRSSVGARVYAAFKALPTEFDPQVEARETSGQCLGSDSPRPDKFGVADAPEHGSVHLVRLSLPSVRQEGSAP